jgi:hypothetical protein
MSKASIRADVLSDLLEKLGVKLDREQIDQKLAGAKGRWWTYGRLTRKKGRRSHERN